MTIAAPQIEFVGCHPDHFEEGRAGYAAEALCYHRMGGSMAGAQSWFNTSLAQRRAAQPGAGRSSANLGLSKRGKWVQYVRFGDTAYANGIVEKWGAKLVNDNAGISPNRWTISIEIEGHAGEPLTPEQREALVHMSAWLFETELFTGGATGVAIDRDHVLKHDDITNTACPGIGEQEMAALIADIEAYGEGSMELTPEQEQRVKEMINAAIQVQVRDEIATPVIDRLAAVETWREDVKGVIDANTAHRTHENHDAAPGLISRVSDLETKMTKIGEVASP